ncbi:CarD family transcriptional regulator, partial [Paracraurococcus lichenis]
TDPNSPIRPRPLPEHGQMNSKLKSINEVARSMRPMRLPVSRPEPTAAAQEAAAREAEGYAAGDLLMHPVHGIGNLTKVKEVAIAGQSLRVLEIFFPANKLTMQVPHAKIAAIGIRRPAGEALIAEAFDVLGGKAKMARLPWIKRAVEYQAKINSGDPRLVAEVIRDLGPNSTSADRSHGEREVFEAALERLALEISTCRGADLQATREQILAAVTPR